jgi:hypothetical protein
VSPLDRCAHAVRGGFDMCGGVAVSVRGNPERSGGLEVEDVEVLRDPLRPHRLGDGGAALLQVPAQHHHLGCRLAMGLADPDDRRI